jgi:membrane associated rhomboid family serine protease
MNKVAGAVKTAAVMVAVLWLVFFVDFWLPPDLRTLGLKPRDVDQIWGILTAPFLHSDLHHLIANSCALFALLAVSFYMSRKLTYKALSIVWIFGGILVWLFAGSASIHIGASGIVFGLIGFLIFAGIFRKEALALICSSIVFFFYGGSLLTLLSYTPGVSWSGHFFGFTSGVFAAWSTQKSKSG